MGCFFSTAKQAICCGALNFLCIVFFRCRQAADESRIKHLEAKVVELELQIMNPEKNELATGIKRLEMKLDEEQKKKESLKVRLKMFLD